MEMSRPSDLLLQSDIEVAAASREQQRNAAQQALDQIGALLHQADDALCNLEDQDILGSAIIRGCKDIADAIGHLANHIDHQSEDERRQLAKACIDDAQNNLLLMNEAEGHCDGHVDNNTGMADSRPVVPITGNRDVSRELSALSEEEVMTAIQAAGTLLRDVEATLRAIDTDEAEEIADVALTVAHLFVASLQSLHATVTPEDLTQATSTSRCRSGGVTVEMLDEESGSGDELNQGKQMPSSWAASKPKGPKRKRIDRLRVLWPPLGPAVASACDWGKDTASQQPLLAVALGMTMWPVAVITAFVGTPLVLADGFLQDMYSNFEDTVRNLCLRSLMDSPTNHCYLQNHSPRAFHDDRLPRTAYH